MNISWKDAIVTLISIIALGVSIKSCTLSLQSVEITNRPYLTIKPVKFTKSDNYLEITNDPKKNSISLKTKFELTNLGKTPATDVKCPEHALSSILDVNNPNNQNAEFPVPFTPCPKADIGPGDTHKMVLIMTVQKNNRQDMKTDSDYFNSGKGYIVWTTPITYSSIYDRSKEYSVEVSYKVYKDQIIFIKSDVK